MHPYDHCCSHIYAQLGAVHVQEQRKAYRRGTQPSANRSRCRCSSQMPACKMSPQARHQRGILRTASSLRRVHHPSQPRCRVSTSAGSCLRQRSSCCLCLLNLQLRLCSDVSRSIVCSQSPCNLQLCQNRRAHPGIRQRNMLHVLTLNGVDRTGAAHPPRHMQKLSSTQA